jgi:hypothetical protein
MTCTRVIIEVLDPPIVLSSDLSRGPQDERLEYVSRFDRLHRPNEAMAAIAVAHLTPAPLLLGREQGFDRAELLEPAVSKQP